MTIEAIAQHHPSFVGAKPGQEGVGGPETPDIKLIRQRAMDNLKATT
ncbi:MAG: hypothetical protein QOJ05_335 [Verrucomicrobiota bacterium]|jgi:hypothetical protein